MKDYAPEVRRADEPARSVGGVYATRVSLPKRNRVAEEADITCGCQRNSKWMTSMILQT